MIALAPIASLWNQAAVRNPCRKTQASRRNGYNLPARRRLSPGGDPSSDVVFRHKRVPQPPPGDSTFVAFIRDYRQHRGIR